MNTDYRLKLYENGFSDLEMAKIDGCSVATICRWRNKLGLTPNTKHERMTDEQKIEILKLLSFEWTIQDIEKETGVFSETIRKLANRRGIKYKKSTTRTPAKEVFGTIGAGGYVELRVPVDGPYGNLIGHGGDKTGYAPLHRMRMQDMLGRDLLPHEIVHHIDGDIYNNSNQNLAIFRSCKEHFDHHTKSRVLRCKEARLRWPGRKRESIHDESKNDGPQSQRLPYQIWF